MMVQYVYSCMSPITSYFTLLVFGMLAIGLRNQFLFIYPVANDSGGKLWKNFQRLSIVCLIVAEIVLFVLLLSKTYTAAILVLPLITGTIVFNIYFERRHYSVTDHLPIKMCYAVDDKNEESTESLKDAYLKPGLKGGPLFPVNYHLLEDELGRIEQYVTDSFDDDETTAAPFLGPATTPASSIINTKYDDGQQMALPGGGGLLCCVGQ